MLMIKYIMEFIYFNNISSIEIKIMKIVNKFFINILVQNNDIF